MIIIHINEQDLLTRNIKLNKKVIQILVSLESQLKVKNNLESYYAIYNFKNCIINIINNMNQLIECVENSIPNVMKVKLACVHAITDGMDDSNIGDYGDTSINLTLEQFLYYYLNTILSITINCCKYIQNNILNNNTKNIIQDNIMSCINKIKVILRDIGNFDINKLSPMCKKFDYNIINNKLQNAIKIILMNIDEKF